jgi:hypothetical protein
MEGQNANGGEITSGEHLSHHEAVALTRASAGTSSRTVIPTLLEGYVSRAAMAAILGVSLSTLDRMVVAGMPSETWGRRTRRFKPSVALAWARREEGA